MTDPNTQVGIGSIGVPTQPAVTSPAANDVDAGPTQPPPPPAMDTAPATAPSTTAPMVAATSCTRDELIKRAAAYLQALASGDLQSLNLHPQARYTENGQTQTLGLGVWLARPKTQFARHLLDESRCSAVTVAVIGEGAQRIIYGVRLRYVEDQLLEIEAQVVYRNTSYYEPDALISMGPDPWTQLVPDSARMSRDDLIHLAERYFDSSTDASLLPPHSADCKRRQNGTLVDRDGDCGEAAGTERFEQRRFPVIDEQAGVVTAILRYKNFVGMYLFKAQSGTIMNIDVIGGANAASTGW